MPEQVIQGLLLIARWLEIIGAAALILGFLIASINWIRNWTKEGSHPAGLEYRRALGRTVLIGLEVLVAATIIKTITVEPTFEGLGFLAIMVAIRTVLGWTMVLEMYGRWPWQRSRPGAENLRMKS
jgi:uncharacterized membrane protein